MIYAGGELQSSWQRLLPMDHQILYNVKTHNFPELTSQFF